MTDKKVEFVAVLSSLNCLDEQKYKKTLKLRKKQGDRMMAF